MTNKPMLSVERELLERAASAIEKHHGSLQWVIASDLRAILDNKAECRCKRYGKDNPHWPCPIHSKPAANPQGEVERLQLLVQAGQHVEDHLSKQIDIAEITIQGLRAQLAERDALLREMRDLAMAIPVLMLAVPNPHDVSSRDKHIESVNALIERCDATLSTSAEPKQRGEPVAHLSLCLKGPNKGNYIVVNELGASGNDIWSPDIPVYADQPSHSGDANEMVAKVVLPFTEKVIRKLQRFQECADDGQGADIGRHWLDLLTQLGLLNRVQLFPALWEITQQGEDALEVSRLNGLRS